MTEAKPAGFDAADAVTEALTLLDAIRAAAPTPCPAGQVDIRHLAQMAGDRLADVLEHLQIAD